VGGGRQTCQPLWPIEEQGGLNRLIAERTSAGTHYQAMGILQQAGVAAVLPLAEMFTSPHARGKMHSVLLPHPHEPGDCAYTVRWKLS